MGVRRLIMIVDHMALVMNEVGKEEIEIKYDLGAWE